MEPERVKHYIVSTDVFWGKMCHSAAVRIDRNRLAVYRTVYHCSCPPEDVPGYIEGKVRSIKRDLGIECAKADRKFNRLMGMLVVILCVLAVLVAAWVQ